MTTTVSAAATGLPATHALANPMPRRGFLAGLAKLPLIGGSVALIGQPRAAAQPATRQILEAYKTWLHYEQRFLAWEMADLPDHIAYYGGTHSERYKVTESYILHFGTGEASSFHRADSKSPPSSRAALILSTAGCSWYDDEAPSDWLIPTRRV